MLRTALLSLVLCVALLHQPAFGQETRIKIVFYCFDPVDAFLVADAHAKGFEGAANFYFTYLMGTGKCKNMGFPRPVMTLKTRVKRFGFPQGRGGWVWGVSHSSDSKVLGYIGLFDTEKSV